MREASRLSIWRSDSKTISRVRTPRAHARSLSWSKSERSWIQRFLTKTYHINLEAPIINHVSCKKSITVAGSRTTRYSTADIFVVLSTKHQECKNTAFQAWLEQNVIGNGVRTPCIVGCCRAILAHSRIDSTSLRSRQEYAYQNKSVTVEWWFGAKSDFCDRIQRCDAVLVPINKYHTVRRGAGLSFVTSCGALQVDNTALQRTVNYNVP